MARHRTSLALLSAGATLIPLLAWAQPAQAACASRTTRSISGTVYGIDNRDINVSIGFDVQATNGSIVNVSDGCPKTGGYSAPQLELNHYVKYDGQPRHSRMFDKTGAPKGYTTRSWRLSNLPSNAKSVFVEVYSRDYANYNDPAEFGPVNTTKYGFVRRVQVPVGTSNVIIRAGENCSYPGGTNGGISGTVRDRAGAAVTPSSVWAFSDLPDRNGPIMGWGMATVTPGWYKLAALASGEVYHLQLTYNGRTYVKRNIRVNRCATTALNWFVG